MKKMNLASQKIRLINIEDIKPNPFQSRRNFNLKKIEKLTASIKEVGILSPLLLRTTPTGFEIIFGNRRLRAASLAGLKKVPAIVISAKDRQCAILSLAENIQRENLTSFEEAEAYYNIISYHGIKRETLEKISPLEKYEIGEKMKILMLEEHLRYKIEEHHIKEDFIKDFLKIHDSKKREEVINTAIKENLTKEDIKVLIKQTNRELSKQKRNTRNRQTNIFLCKNTVKKTVNLLKENGEKVEFNQKEDHNYLEFNIKIKKEGIF